VTLPAFAAARRAVEAPQLMSAGQQAIDRCPASRALSSKPAAAACE